MIRQHLRPLTPQLSGLVAACLLGAMGLIMLGSAWEDALTMDEPIHLTAGYTYLRFRAARLNPEHSPLLKLCAALPLLPLPLSHRGNPKMPMRGCRAMCLWPSSGTPPGCLICASLGRRSLTWRTSGRGS